MSGFRGRGYGGRGDRGGYRGIRQKGPGPVPDKWFDHKTLGERIPNTQFIVFKTPLKKEIYTANDVPADKRFTPSDLLKMIKDKGQEMGLVIDMTNTKRYYQPDEFTSQGVKYEKMQLTGHGQIPSEDDVQRFRMIVDRFLTKNYNKLVGVHGTTSTNRPGYLICRYLIERQNVEPAKAIEFFNKARGHPIDEQVYIDELMSFEPVRKTARSSDEDEDDLLQDLAGASIAQDCEERRPNGFSADDYSY